VQALVGGGVQYAIIAPEHVIRLRNRGVDGVVAVALDTHHTYVLVAKNTSPLKSFADLKERRVGITSSGSLTESLLKLQAKREGLNADIDFEIVGSGVGAAMKAAIDTGRIEAGMFGNLEAERLLLEGYKVVFDWRPQEIPNLALISTATWQAANSKIARDFAAATLRAQKEITTDRETAVDYLRKTYPTLDERVLLKDAESLATRLSHDGIYDEASITRLQDDLQQIEPSLKRVPYADVMPLTYLK
jgi:NitT/TauT family transport system substrate-binding protein